ncbi:H/ACA ribonucleoprotein complex subunit GAR1 [Candidatus Nitrosotenuis cloacae]|uniref:H/ACA ribonucleoprotein complex subunit GAR1 n=1 Tax=Candidatus Nitrosotenuis cloacae TaxID=1603555 RepID=UPI00227E8721|nr:Gar1/Naf1 family protein [Candidatus Nitrosotenuis cloacae]
MQEVGEIIHLASSGRVIIRLSRQLDEGDYVCDESGRRIGKVTELIGPVSGPYASAISLTNNIKKYVGTTVYFLDEPAIRHDRTRRRRR